MRSMAAVLRCLAPVRCADVGVRGLLQAVDLPAFMAQHRRAAPHCLHHQRGRGVRHQRLAADQLRAHPAALRVTILRNYWGVVPIEVFFCPLGDPDKEAPWPIPILLFCVREDVRGRLECKEERLSPQGHYISLADLLLLGVEAEEVVSSQSPFDASEILVRQGRKGTFRGKEEKPPSLGIVSYELFVKPKKDVSSISSACVKKREYAHRKGEN